MELKQAIGDTIRRLRMERNMTLRKMAPYISLGHLSEVEHGRNEISSVLFEVVAQGLQISTAELLKEVYEYLQENNER